MHLTPSVALGKGAEALDVVSDFRESVYQATTLQQGSWEEAATAAAEYKWDAQTEKLSQATGETESFREIREKFSV